MSKFRRLEKGFGNISLLPGNRRKPHRARKTIGYNKKGHQIYETVGYYKSYTEALEALVEYNNNPYDLNKKDVTLKEMLNLWFKEQKEILLPNTYRNWVTARKNLAPLENRTFNTIRSNDLQKIIDNLEVKSAKNKVKSLMNNLYKLSTSLDMNIKNYSELLKITDGKITKKDKVAFTDEELRMLYEKRGTDQLYDIVLILLFTGFRATELLTIDKSMIFLDENKFVGGIKTDSGKNRTIPISRHIKPILEKYMNNNKKYLFYNTHKNRYTYSNLKNAMSELNHTTHECRHTFSSNFYRTSADKLTIKKIVGHKSQDLMEDVYVHKTDDELQTTMKEFDDYMEKVLCF